MQQRYIAVATYIRNNFFEGYPGLRNRIYREQQYAADHGYCRTYFGMTRNLIELMLKGSYDEEHSAKTLRNLGNIAANVRCQNMEACIRGRAMYEIQQWLKNTGKKSRVWNEIHDSMDFYIYKSELHDVLSHIKHICERKVPELADNWIPLLVDAEISDLTDKEHHDCYKGGRPYIDFDESVKYEELQYEDPDPFGVELRDDFEEEYFKLRKEHWKRKGLLDPLELKIIEYLNKKKGA